MEYSYKELKTLYIVLHIFFAHSFFDQINFVNCLDKDPLPEVIHYSSFLHLLWIRSLFIFLLILESLKVYF